MTIKTTFESLSWWGSAASGVHGGEVSLVHGLDACDLVEVVGAERAQPGEGAGRKVAEGAGRTSGTTGRRGNCFGGGSVVKDQLHLRHFRLTMYSSFQYPTTNEILCDKFLYAMDIDHGPDLRRSASRGRPCAAAGRATGAASAGTMSAAGAEGASAARRSVCSRGPGERGTTPVCSRWDSSICCHGRMSPPVTGWMTFEMLQLNDISRP